MHENFVTYCKRVIKDATTASINVAMFIPYFFSVLSLSKSLFSPWKNIVNKEDKPGFNMDSLMQKIGDNFASRLIGFMVRGSILTAYVIVQVVFVFVLPFVYIATILLLPLSYVFYTIQPTEKEKKDLMFNQFMRRHLADQKNQQKVVQWFETYYKGMKQEPWWTLKSLLKQPPLGRDLAYGFTNTLDKFSDELTLKQPHHKHLIGRKSELEIIQRVLTKSNEANVLLSGEVGVGKQAIIEALAKAVYEGTINQNLAYKRVLQVDLDKVLAQSVDYVQREEILDTLFKEASEAKNVIIVIKDIDRYVSNEQGRIDLTTVLAKYASGSTIQFVATTTPYMFQKYIFQNKQIVSIFDKVDIQEISPDDSLRILLDIAPELEKRHTVNIVYEALEEAVHKSDRYITSTPLPEKAIELLDEACVYAKTQGAGKAVDAHMINTVLSQKVQVPTEVTDSLKQKLLNLEKRLKQRVFFQDSAIQSLAIALRKAFVSLSSHKKPLASFLFLGPTGVGKTETAKAVTEVFFDSDENLIRLDMSNYQTSMDIPKLIGSPEMNEPGHLTQAVRNKRFGTLLLDELEKADQDLLNIFLTILDEGYFTDGFGKRVDCSNLIIVATSNAGADFIYEHMSDSASAEEISTQLVDHLIEKNIYSPEFLNRFDGVVVYKPLYKEAMVQIASHMLKDIQQSAQKEHGIALEFSGDFIKQLVDRGYDPRYGARNMRRLITSEVEDKLSQMILEGSTQGKSLKF